MDHFAWQHIEFENGSNPYICKTAEAMDLMRQKYTLVPLRDNFWLAKTPTKGDCVWKYRSGTNGAHFARSSCRLWFNYLSKLRDGEPFVGVADWYNGKQCPSCGRPIRIDYSEIQPRQNKG